MKMLKNIFIFLLALATLSIVGLFAFQNFEAIELQFMSWTTPSIPLAGALVASFVMGVVVAGLFFLLEVLRLKNRNRKTNKTLKKVEKELEALRTLPIDEEPMDRPVEVAELIEEAGDDVVNGKDTTTQRP